ncbi:MAG: hypothetical protein WCO78_05585 [Candidatus Roizmanbacteria bacterium]
MAINRPSRTIDRIRFVLLTLFFGAVIVSIPFVLRRAEASRYGFFSEIRDSRYTISAIPNGFELNFHVDRNRFGILDIEMHRSQDFHVIPGGVIATLLDTDGSQMVRQNFRTSDIDTTESIILIGFEPREDSVDKQYRLRMTFSSSGLALQYLSHGGLRLRVASFGDYASYTRSGGNIISFLWSKVEVIQSRLTDRERVIFLYFGFFYYPLYWLIRWQVIRRNLIGKLIEYLKKRLTEKYSLAHNQLQKDDRRLVFIKLYLRWGRELLVRLWHWYSRHHLRVNRVIVSVIWLFAGVIIAQTAVEITDTAYLWWIGSYIFISLVLRVDARMQYLMALIALLYAPYFLYFEKEAIAEKMAIFTYFYLCFGVFTDGVTMFRERLKRNRG